MSLSRRLLIGVWVLAIPALTATSAMARGFEVPSATSGAYSGSYPVTVTHSQRGDGTYCLTLTQTGKNAGSATLIIGSQKFPNGSFQIFNHTLVATIQAQGYGQNAGLVFIGSAHHGTIGPGVFDEVYGGSAFEEGALSFGMKGGC